MSDELIYRVKLELDQKSREELEKQLKSIESLAKSKSSGGSVSSDVEKEISALKELKQQLASYREELAKVNQQASQSATTNDSLRSSQTQLGSAIRETSTQIQEANKDYSDQQNVLKQTSDALEDLNKEQQKVQYPTDSAENHIDVLKKLDEQYKKEAESLAELKKIAQSTEALSKPTVSQSSRKKETEEEVSALKELRQRLKENREDLAMYNKLQREGVVLSEEFATAQKDTAANIQELSQQIQEATRGYADQSAILSALPNTYNELTEQNRALSIAMKQVPLDDTSGLLQELQKRYKANNDRLKEFDGAIGNNQRNVGNYKSALDGTVVSLRTMATAFGIVQGPLGPLAGRINSFATFLSKVDDEGEQTGKTLRALGLVLTGNIPLIQTSATALTAKGVGARLANGGIKVLNVSLKALRLAFIGLGLPAIAIAIVSITQAFKRTEEGAQRLRVATARFNAILEVFKDILGDVGTALLDAFESPQQAIKDLWQAVQTNLVNRFKAVPEIFISFFKVITNGGAAAGEAIRGIFSPEAKERSKELFGDMQKELVNFFNATTQLASGIEDPLQKIADGYNNISEQVKADSQAAEALETRLNAVLVRERELGVEREKQNRDLQKTREIARELNVSAEERLKAINDIAVAESSLLEQELANERERLNIMLAEAELSQTSEETKQEIADQQQKIFELERLSIEKNISLTRDRNSVQSQLNEQELRRIRHKYEIESGLNEMSYDELRTRLQNEGRIREALAIDLKRIENTRAQEEQRLKEQYEAEFRANKETADNAAQMAEEKARLEMEQRIYKAKKDLNEQILTETRSANTFDRELEEQGKNFAIENKKNELIERGNLIAAARLNELSTEEGKNARLKELSDIFYQRLRDENIEPLEAKRRADAQAKLQTDQEVYENEVTLAKLSRDQKLQMAQQISSGIGALNSAFFNDSKELAVAGAIMDTYAAVVKALAAPPGFPYNLAGVVAAGATGIANVKKILSTKLGDKNVSSEKPQQPNVSTSFGLVDVGTNAPIAEQVAGMTGMTRQNMNPTFVFTGDLDPEVMAIKVKEGSNAISGKTVGIGI
jgi:myosin heavy subunit